MCFPGRGTATSREGITKLLGAVAVPVLGVVVVGSAMLDSGAVFEPPFLFAMLLTFFVGVISFAVAFATARSFLMGGLVNVLLFSCGVTVFGLTGLVAAWLATPPGGPNVVSTIANTGALVGALCIYVSVFFPSVGIVWQISRQRMATIVFCYLVLFAFVDWLTIASLRDDAPIFFVQGVGPTPLRQLVLGSAIVLLTISSQLFMLRYMKSKISSAYWYSLALMMITLGHVALLFEHAVGSTVSWAGRLAILLGGVYFVPAVLDVIGGARVKGIGLEQAIAEFFSESEENLVTLTDTSPFAVVSFDSDGRVLLWNPAAERIFGYTRREAVGSSVFDLVVSDRYVPVVRTMLMDLSVKGTRSPSGWTMEIEAKRRDGVVFPAELSISLRETDSGRVVIAILRDISERKRMEQALLRSERMAAVGETVAMVAHDLRNPLTGISGAAYYLKKKLGPKPDRESIGMLNLIEGAIEHMNKIMNDLLEYSRETRLEVNMTDPRSVTQQALASVAIPENVRVSNLTRTHPRIGVDATKMTRVFANLIRNAIDAMPEGGDLTIRSKERNGEVQIIFTDTGTGIPEDALERIWAPTYTTKARGIGLGLPIVKRFVEAHNGSVVVESEVGKGSTFTVKLPLRTDWKKRQQTSSR
jgi:PAS domain S-box-containing protein